MDPVSSLGQSAEHRQLMEQVRRLNANVAAITFVVLLYLISSIAVGFYFFNESRKASEALTQAQYEYRKATGQLSPIEQEIERLNEMSEAGSGEVVEAAESVKKHQGW